MGGVSASSDVSTDGRVQQLQSQIKDWTNCPTTDPQTKRQIVGKLENELDGVESAIKQHDAVKKEMAGAASESGVGGRLDTYA
jgi:hypothetical protein